MRVAHNFIDRVGQKHGRLLVLRRGSGVSSGNKVTTTWVCVCDCGQVTEVRSGDLIAGRSQSCGCLRVDLLKRNNPAIVKHGRRRGQKEGKRDRTYTTWIAMLSRCYNEEKEQWPYYGGRGIKVCKRWRHSFVNFLADMGERPEGRTLDRINNNGNYKKSNCRWATPSEQSFNQRKRKKK